MMLRRRDKWDDGKEGERRKTVSAAAKGRIVLPSQLELVVCLGRYKQQASTHAQPTSRKVHRIERGWVGESARTVAKGMLSCLLYTLIMPTVLMFKLQMHHEMQHALRCSENKDHACCSWMRSSSAMFHSCSCISSCSASAAAVSAAVCRCICAFTAALLAC